MKFRFAILIISFCLTGCSEMRVIGNAAMRELRAEGVAVDWSRPVQVAKAESDSTLTDPVKVKSFSAFRGNKIARKMPVRGLWEPHGS